MPGIGGSADSRDPGAAGDLGSGSGPALWGDDHGLESGGAQEPEKIPRKILFKC